MPGRTLPGGFTNLVLEFDSYGKPVNRDVPLRSWTWPIPTRFPPSEAQRSSRTTIDAGPIAAGRVSWGPGASGHGRSQGIACWQRPSPARRAAAGGLGYVFRSTDGGASYTYLATTPRTSTSIAFVTASRWLELVVPSQPDETLDAGASWHAYTSDYSQAAPVAPGVVFADSQSAMRPCAVD